GGTADRNRSHWSTSKTPSYTKSVSWHHHRGVLEDIMSIPDSSLRKRLGYEVLSFSLQAHSLSQECIDKLDIFFADDLFKYESVCIAAMEHLKSKATAPIQNGPLPA
ncbi:hypothetical protein SNA02_14260, partial [Escherichia coli]|nr:hypothetical protein [Escherichia coli]